MGARYISRERDLTLPRKLVSALKSLNLQAISDPATARTSGLQVATSPSASPSTPGRLLPGLELNINYSLPFVLTRLSLFQCYFAIHPNLPALFSATRLWLESHSLSAISPTCLASLCISYLQVSYFPCECSSLIDRL
jgi:hypothetical protein